METMNIILNLGLKIFQLEAQILNILTNKF